MILVLAPEFSTRILAEGSHAAAGILALVAANKSAVAKKAAEIRWAKHRARVRSTRKARAARQNAKLGGWPKVGDGANPKPNTSKYRPILKELPGGGFTITLR